MKKLVFAAIAAFGMAMTASASAVVWGWNDLSYEDANGEAFSEKGTAFLYVLTSEDATVSFKDGVWNLNGAKLVEKSGWNEDLTGWGSDAGNDSPLVNAGTVKGADQQYFSLILVDGNASDLASYVGEGKNAYIVSGQGEQYKAGVTAEGAVYGTDFTQWDDIEMAGWTSLGGSSPTPGIPEPTSGLLLVVGGAMLALRRRRA